MDRAPLNKTTFRRLERDARDVAAAARRKGLSIPDYEIERARRAADEHFALGCWLHHYRDRVGAPDGLGDRVDCLRRLFLEGVFSPGYDYHIVFDFGERQFDAIFEMGDADRVIEGLRAMIPGDETGMLAKGFEYFKWPIKVSDAPVKAGACAADGGIRICDEYLIRSQYKGGVVIVERVSDGASVHLQGDDASRFWGEYDACNGDEQLIRLCSDYDDVMSLPAAPGA